MPLFAAWAGQVDLNLSFPFIQDACPLARQSFNSVGLVNSQIGRIYLEYTVDVQLQQHPTPNHPSSCELLSEWVMTTAVFEY